MIERNKLGLREITCKEYDSLMAEIGKPTFHSESDFCGFAEITEPLEYESYGELLRHFAETPGARRVSVKRDEYRRRGERWRRVDVSHVVDQIESLTDEARKQGFLYVSFYCKERHEKIISNEISFEVIKANSPRVKSVSIEIPGDERALYNWKGSQKPYPRILGVYARSPKKF